MIAFKTVLPIIVGLYLISFGLLVVLRPSTSLIRSFQEENKLSQIDQTNRLFFENSTLASIVLHQLHSFDHPDIKPAVRRQGRQYLNLKDDPDYCSKNLANFAEDPESVFDEINFITDMSYDSLLREKAAPRVAYDIQPQIGVHMDPHDEELYDIEPYANIFFTRKEFHSSKQIGKEFSCLAQASSHIPGHEAVCNKDEVAEFSREYIKEFHDRPQCINNDKYFPKTWLLYDKEDCKEFFTALNSENYQRLKEERKIVYIRKVGKGAHMGEGVQPFNDVEEAELRKIYDNGNLCGQVSLNYLIQNYIHNPLLLNGHKFDFRMYLLVASTDPLIAHYHDGFLRVSLSPYDATSTDKSVLLTNLALSNQLYDDVKKGNLYKGMDEEGLKHAQQWSFERLQAHLLETGVISDPNWLDNYLRPEFKKAFIHLLRFASKKFLVHNSLYELYGADFMLDADLNLWYIEANSAPGLGGYSKPIEKIIVKMLRDHFEVIIGLVRSRMKRVAVFVNQLIESGAVVETMNGDVLIRELDKRREEFRQLTKNHYEKEFEPSAKNGFKKIIDLNYPGTGMYQGFIEEECL